MDFLNQSASSTASDSWASNSAEHHLASVDGRNSLRGLSVKNPPVVYADNPKREMEVTAIREAMEAKAQAEGYRLLYVGDVLQEGDEFGYAKDQWVRTSSVGQPVLQPSNSIPSFRRKLNLP